MFKKCFCLVPLFFLLCGTSCKKISELTQKGFDVKARNEALETGFILKYYAYGSLTGDKLSNVQALFCPGRDPKLPVLRLNLDSTADLTFSIENGRQGRHWWYSGNSSEILSKLLQEVGYPNLDKEEVAEAAQALDASLLGPEKAISKEKAKHLRVTAYESSFRRTSNEAEPSDETMLFLALCDESEALENLKKQQ